MKTIFICVLCFVSSIMAQSSLPLIDGYKTFKWKQSFNSISAALESSSASTITKDSLMSSENTPLEVLAGTELFTDIQCLEVSENDGNQVKTFKYLFCDSILIGLQYTNESANPDDIIKTLISKYGLPKETLLADKSTMGFKAKSTIYEWKGQKGKIRAQTIIVDGSMLYDALLAKQVEENDMNYAEMEILKSSTEEQKKQLMKASIIGPLYISNSFILKQQEIAKTQKQKSSSTNPSTEDDF